MVKKLIAATLACAAIATCMVGCGKDKPTDPVESVPASSIVMSESDVSSEAVASDSVTSEDTSAVESESVAAEDESAIEKDGSDLTEVESEAESTSAAASSVKAG